MKKILFLITLGLLNVTAVLAQDYKKGDVVLTQKSFEDYRSDTYRSGIAEDISVNDVKLKGEDQFRSIVPYKEVTKIEKSFLGLETFKAEKGAIVLVDNLSTSFDKRYRKARIAGIVKIQSGSVYLVAFRDLNDKDESLANLVFQKYTSFVPFESVKSLKYDKKTGESPYWKVGQKVQIGTDLGVIQELSSNGYAGVMTASGKTVYTRLNELYNLQ